MDDLSNKATAVETLSQERAIAKKGNLDGQQSPGGFMSKFPVLHPSIIGFRSGSCRNNDYALSHTYAETEDGLFPMCGYGWNRSDGERFSIFRGTPGTLGDCRLCAKNLKAGKPPIINGFKHKTRWI